MTTEQRATLRRDTMDAFNAARVTVHGVRVRVDGARLPFAQVSIADPKHPFHGWSVEYSWQTIMRAAQRGTLT